jgi:hypothetical protein
MFGTTEEFGIANLPPALKPFGYRGVNKLPSVRKTDSQGLAMFLTTGLDSATQADLSPKSQA